MLCWSLSDFISDLECVHDFGLGGYNNSFTSHLTGWKGAHTPAARTLMQLDHGYQTHRVLPVELVIAAQAEVGPPMLHEEQMRLQRYKRLNPPKFSEAESEDAHGYQTLVKLHLLLFN